MEVTKRGIHDGEFLEFAGTMVDTTARRTHQVLGKIRHFVIKVRVQGLHIRKFRGELFLLLQQPPQRCACYLTLIWPLRLYGGSTYSERFVYGALISVTGFELFVQPRFGPSLGKDGGHLDQEMELSVL